MSEFDEEEEDEKDKDDIENTYKFDHLQDPARSRNIQNQQVSNYYTSRNEITI